jgi:hypothetical protein
MDRYFINLCQEGDLLGAQRCLQYNPTQYNPTNANIYDTAFFNTCARGHLEVAQWLLQISEEKGQDIDISEKVFHITCYHGHLEVAQWLLLTKPMIDISANDELAFRYACFNGHLHIAQWLFQVSKENGREIDISARDNSAFHTAFKNMNLHLAKWLQSLKPDLYIIKYDTNKKCIGYQIRTKQEANWERRKYPLFLSTVKEEPNLLYQLPTDIAKMVLQFV